MYRPCIVDISLICVDLDIIKFSGDAAKALAAGATACSFGKAFLFRLGAGGQKGVERLLDNMQNEIRRNMILMGCKNIKDLDASKIIYRN